MRVHKRTKKKEENSKSHEYAEISVKIFKVGKYMKEEILTLIDKTWGAGNILEDWSEPIIISIYKSNGISLGGHSSKV